MKKKALLMICFCVSGLSALLLVLSNHFPDIFTSAAAFPFEQIAAGLNFLSKEGPAGRGLAAALWIGLSLIPAMTAFRYGKGKETGPEKITLYVLSAVILLALYGMVNPQLFRPETLPEGFSVYPKLVNASLGISVWSFLVLYITLRLIRLFRQGDKRQLFGYMQAVLYALCAVFAAAAAGSLAGGAASLSDPSKTHVDQGFGIIFHAAKFIPYLFDIAIIIRVLKLFEIASTDRQEGIVEAAGRVSGICCRALITTTAVTAAVNILQVILMPGLSDISITMDIPTIDIAFTVMILLFSRLLAENRKLRDDNELFI